MSLFKYFTQAGTLRYLSTWALRITPPDQFNDPFEMRPRFTVMTAETIRDISPGLLQKELVTQLAEAFQANDDANKLMIIHCLVRCLTDVGTDEDKRILLAQLDASQHESFDDNLAPFRELVKNARQQISLIANAQMPSLNRKAEVILHTQLRTQLGVLCLSGSGTNALMWSHYADSHRGVLIEFDQCHPTFNRRRNSEDDLGFFRPVSYSETRPHINAASGEESFAHLALTKALEWAYEKEKRLIWPLTMADRHVPTDTETIHLLDVPPNAVKNISVGCRASAAFVEQVATALSAVDEAVHIKVYQAAVDDDAFKLNYKAIR